MKPKIGSKVYIIVRDELWQDYVTHLGKESFITQLFIDGLDDEGEQSYSEFNETWFRSLAKGKKALLKQEQEHCFDDEKLKIVGHGLDDDFPYWQVELDENE